MFLGWWRSSGEGEKDYVFMVQQEKGSKDEWMSDVFIIYVDG